MMADPCVLAFDAAVKRLRPRDSAETRLPEKVRTNVCVARAADSQ